MKTHLGVGPLLVAPCRPGAMSGVDHRVIGEGKHLLVNRASQRLGAAAGKVTPSDTAAEKDIAAERQAGVTSPDKRDVPRRVAGHIEDIKLDSPVLEDIAFLDR